MARQPRKRCSADEKILRRHPIDKVPVSDLRDQHIIAFEKQYLAELMQRHHGDVINAAVGFGLCSLIKGIIPAIAPVHQSWATAETNCDTNIYRQNGLLSF